MFSRALSNESYTAILLIFYAEANLSINISLIYTLANDFSAFDKFEK